jgi:hypothetical protein
MEDVCVGVLPLNTATRYLDRGSMQHYFSSQNPKYFGEHSVCVTTLESSKKDPKIIALMAILKSQALKGAPF